MEQSDPVKICHLKNVILSTGYVCIRRLQESGIKLKPPSKLEISWKYYVGYGENKDFLDRTAPFKLYSSYTVFWIELPLKRFDLLCTDSKALSVMNNQYQIIDLCKGIT